MAAGGNVALATANEPPSLSDCPAPAGTSTIQSLGARLTPQQFITFYSPDEWEEFTRELAEVIQEDYFLIKRLGGPNDHGIDIAGLLADQGLQGEWDCYQCKHYEKALEPVDAWTEILKVFRAVRAGHYTMPKRYWFVAPKGAGLTLDAYFTSPETLRTEFLKWLNENNTIARATTAEERLAITALATSTDFARFQAMPPADIVNLHSRTKYHAVRFAVPVPPRGDVGAPPEALAGHEVRYVDQLLAVYVERHGDDSMTREGLAVDGRTSTHFGRQRQAFYTAEALRIHARDAVPENTFARLQSDLLDGVVETAERDHSTGYERMQSVLEASTQLDLSRHELIQIAGNADRKGVCHQLVNDSRLTWLDDGAT